MNVPVSASGKDTRALAPLTPADAPGPGCAAADAQSPAVKKNMKNIHIINYFATFTLRLLKLIKNMNSFLFKAEFP